MKQFWLQVVALMIVIFVGMWISLNPASLNSLNSVPSVLPVGNNAIQKVAIVSPEGGTKSEINIEVADTPQKRGVGLGGRDTLSPDSGMLFIFEQPSVPRFWMQGMKISIDIIWINNDTVIGVAQNVPPPQGTPGEVLPTYSPATSVDKSLEVSAGFVKQHNIKVGDKLKQIQ